ncbi:TadE/TadG family type IV pilus assembly protein [Sandarakinorhabdus rubra]|uniref:TadE/TadG family type IV pilus assembly protein n=1 Tax=Sandarakinorhabdus rubra TaxID=2672568 RepID=UPI0013DA122F|nr:TadE family protein [Sandarakinorhabdus rubra]
MRRLLALFADRHGGSAAEFALVLPVFGGMVLGALEFGNAWSTRLALEQAAQAGIEAVASKRSFNNGFGFALTEAQTRWGKPLTSSSMDTWLECDGARQAADVTNCASGQQRARYVSIVLRAEYVPGLNFGGFVRGSGPSGGFIITGDAAVRTQ